MGVGSNHRHAGSDTKNAARRDPERNIFTTKAAVIATVPVNKREVTRIALYERTSVKEWDSIVVFTLPAFEAGIGKVFLCCAVVFNASVFANTGLGIAEFTCNAVGARKLCINALVASGLCGAGRGGTG